MDKRMKRRTLFPLIRILPEARSFFRLPAKRLRLVDEYALAPDFYPTEIRARIYLDEEEGKLIYHVEEPPLNEMDKLLYQEVLGLLYYEPPINPEAEDFEKEIVNTIARLVKKYHVLYPGSSIPAVMYYVIRDTVGASWIDPLLRDPYIEDISCNGADVPIYVWHQRHEYLKTTLALPEEELDMLVLKLAYMGRRHISIANPIVDAILPGGHRLAATYRKEVTTGGSTFTIRKFREEPITITELINYRTIDTLIAAYAWEMMEWKRNGLILGVTGSGKSVSGDALVLAVARGRPGLYTFDELWSIFADEARCDPVTGYCVVEFPDLLVRTCNPASLECFWARPSKLIRHPNDKRILRVRLRSGRYVDVTEDHSLIVVDGSGVHEEPPSPSVIGKYVVVPLLGLRNNYSDTSLVLRELNQGPIYVLLDGYVKGLVAEAVKRLGWKKVLRVTSYGSTSVFRTQHKLRLDKFLALLDEAQITPDWKRLHICGRVGDCVPVTKLLEPSVGYLLGLYLAEGSLSGHSPRITQRDVERVARVLDELGCLYSVVKPRSRAPFVDVGGWCSAVIKALFGSATSRDKRLPSLYWLTPLKWRTAFLKGYLDGDGYIGKCRVEAVTASKQLALDLLYAFSELGILAVLREKKLGDRIYYQVVIPAPYLERLRELDIANAECPPGNHTWSVYENIPAQLFMDDPELLRNIGKLSKKGLGMLMLRFYEGKPIGKRALAKLLQVDTDSPLQRVINAPLVFDKIVSVEPAPGTSFVYDFEVPGTNAFEANNIVVHNTTLLNAIATLINPSYKVVTIEDTPELRLPLENWVQLVSREYGVKGGGGEQVASEVTLFDLVKVSLRYRPEIIIVGEVRGEEAYVLFQAMATGHGGLSTLHAESIYSAVERLTSPPMNIPKAYMNLIHFSFLVRRVELEGRIQRRVAFAWEVRKYGDYHEVFRWRYSTDDFEHHLENSITLKNIAENFLDTTVDEMVRRIARKALVFYYMWRKKIFSFDEIATLFSKYYGNKEYIMRVVEDYVSGVRERDHELEKIHAILRQ